MHSPSLAPRDFPALDFPYGGTSLRNHSGGARSNRSSPDGPEGPLLLVPARHILQIPFVESPNAVPHDTKLLAQPHKSLSLE